MITLTVHYLDPSIHPKIIEVENNNFNWDIYNTSTLGPSGIDNLGEDLVELSMLVFHLETYIYPFRKSPLSRIIMQMPVRKPAHWKNKLVVESLQQTLYFMLPILWEFKFTKAVSPRKQQYKKDEREIKQVVLFSGGMDSTCGLAAYKKELADTSKLVSFYKRQKNMQQGIVKDLGYKTPGTQIQFTSEFKGPAIQRKNKTFFYRSFMFLSLAAIVARSYRIGKMIQFENGILATALPVSASVNITRHAHPVMHQLYIKFLEHYFQESYSFEIENPFLWLTKGQAYILAKKDNKNFDAVLSKTETCWYHYSNFSLDGKPKQPNKACGICIPCLIRRLADPGFEFEFDILKRKINSNDKVNFIYSTYLAFVERIEQSKKFNSFYVNVLDGYTRELVDNNILHIDKLFILFKQFSKDFRKIFS